MLYLVKLSLYLSSISKYHHKLFARNSVTSISHWHDMEIQEIKTVFMNVVQNEVYCDMIDLKESLQNVAATNSSSVRCQIT